MPQLMPLNWIFSSMMLVLLLASACMIYSNMSKSIMGNNTTSSVKNILWLW
uniref:ATP synthase F0 subunit 8 n=1 Tax=Cyclosa argenteoalba TaxID=345692 RepID=A0A0K0NTN7_9ARAC|nr:ATP synthase F0 subunit 8 [Cyclosa argenteoalba]AKN58351.1 ATP synthase F0 subunit 8 [Cyclosa argenteoalba]